MLLSYLRWHGILVSVPSRRLFKRISHHFCRLNITFVLKKIDAAAITLVRLFEKYIKGREKMLKWYMRIFRNCSRNTSGRALWNWYPLYPERCFLLFQSVLRQNVTYFSHFQQHDTFSNFEMIWNDESL